MSPGPERAGLRLAYRLLSRRKRLSFAYLTLARVAVGFCDLMLASAMYVVFLLLQGGSPVRPFWWLPKTILAAASSAVVLLIVRSLLDLSSTRAVIRYVQDIYTDFLLRLAHGYSEMQWSEFVRENRSDLINHTTHTGREAANIYHRGIELISAIIIVAMMAAALIYENSIAACGLTITVSLFYGIHRVLIRNGLESAGRTRERSVGLLQKILADMFSSGKETRTYHNQAFFQERVREHGELAATSNVRVMFLPQVARIMADQGVVLLFLAVIITVQLRHGEAKQLLSILVFYFVLSRRLLPLVSQISFLAGSMEASYENVRLIARELNRCTIFRAPRLLTSRPAGDVVMELDHVSFSFDDAPILCGLSLSLRKGETIVLHGVSGCGKSSLLNLIAGILQPTSGTVRVDRRRVAYVPQEIVLLDDSIRNNLLFGLDDRSDADLMSALSIAELDGLVTELAMGLETRVGDNGVLFSGGQRQQLGIARAVLRQPTLLLLDEATAGLDEASESEVLRNFSQTKVAVLLVTHRIRARRFAGRVFRLEEFQLFEEQEDPVFEDDPVLVGRNFL